MVTIKNVLFDFEYFITNLAKKYIMGTKFEQWVQTFKCS